MMREARTNKTAQGFFFRQRDMERRAEMDSFTRGLRQAEEERKSELFPIQKEVEHAKLNAQVALEKMRLNKEKRDAESALRVATDTDAFESKVGQLMQTHRPGSKEFAEGLLGIVSTHPYVPADLRKTWMSQADIDTDPDQLMRDTEKFRSTHDTTLKVNDKGKWTVALSEKRPVSTTATPGAGTITTTEDENGKITTSVRRPFNQSDADSAAQKRERERLENQHVLLEGELQNKKNKVTGAPDMGVLSRLNEVKQKLGYTLLDSVGQPVAKVAETVTTEIPTLTEKSQFDALPSGAKYIRNGVTYLKP